MKISELFVINEAREGNLYHATSYLNSINILIDNKMLGKTIQTMPNRLPKKVNAYPGQGLARGVSLTRNLQFAIDWAKGFGNEQVGGIVFTLDHALLYRDFGKKIQPIDYFQTSVSNPDEDTYRKGKRRMGVFAEAEEFVIGDINNLGKYIKCITLLTELHTKEEIENNHASTSGFGLPAGMEKQDLLLNNPKLNCYNVLTKKLYKLEK